MAGFLKKSMIMKKIVFCFLLYTFALLLSGCSNEENCIPKIFPVEKYLEVKVTQVSHPIQIVEN